MSIHLQLHILNSPDIPSNSPGCNTTLTRLSYIPDLLRLCSAVLEKVGQQTRDSLTQLMRALPESSAWASSELQIN